MGRERHGHRLPRGRPRLPPGLLAAAVLCGLALFAFPYAAAGGGPRSWSDTQGPSIPNLAISANPVVPPDDVVVTALARDDASNVTSGEFYFDAPGPSGFSAYRMTPSDGVADSLTESLFWTGTYDVFTQRLSAGSHVLYVHAMDVVGNWGNYSTLDFYVGSPQTIGPSAYLFGISPANVTIGASVTITGSVVDRYGQTVRAAEFFLDRPGAGGTGWAMNASDGAFDGAAEAVVWSGVLAPPFGNHTVWMQGSNGNVWGPAASLPFTLRAPAFTLALVVAPTSAVPGDPVTYSLSFDNHGNADPSTLWVNVTLPSTVTYLDDTAAGVGGTGNGTHYVFAPVTGASNAFDIHARVVTTATDGRPLDATATLDLTNELGWNFPAISASASGLVLAPEVDLSLSLPAILNAGEVWTLVVTIDNTGIRVIPGLTLAVTVPPDAQVVGDTAASQGGQRVPPNAWRFANLPMGRLSFDVSAAVSSLAADRETLSWTATADFTSRLG
ncbi:MAG TPA: hypothetical protein VEM95_07330, partial [Thermoplasmata archaeon]|nr:hypothetical protein [Thermoplasmata archaeon]